MSFLIYMKQALSNLFKPPVTTSYPLKPKTFKPHDRGRVINDISRCILCGQCMRTCPAGAITVDRTTGIWKINPFACVQCAGCVEVCPKKCLHMDPEAAAPDVKKSEIILQVKKEDGVSRVQRKVAAINMAEAAMDDRSHIVNNIMKCIFCGQCMRNCPSGAITVDRRSRTWRINLEACVNCGTCIDNCPRKCLSLGCYLGNPSEITMKGSRPPVRRRPSTFAPAEKEGPLTSPVQAAKPEAPAENPMPAVKAEEATVPDTHIRIEAEKCLFCGKCEHNCPAGAISIDRRNRTWTIDREKCITCGVCADGCPARCLTLADAWEAGEKKEMKSTYQGKVLRRPPAGRKPASAPAPSPIKEEKAAEASTPKPSPVKEAATEASVPDTHIRIEAEKCLFCGKCEHNCPAGAISIDRRNRTWTIDREKCITCGVCADGCPARCLTLADAWEAGEKKEMKSTYQGKVLRRPPAGRKPASAPAPSPVKEEKAAEAPTPKPAPVKEAAPEASVPDTHIRIEAEKCLFCGKCEHNCPADAISIDRRNRTWTIDREKCITCGVCADGCPARCLTLADAWEAGEKKEMKSTYQGKVLRRPPRPVPVRKEAPKDGEPHA